MAHESGSFDYKVINKLITDVLDNRSRLNNTVQVAMPFVKATTTIEIPEILGLNNIGFTLGLHGINEDVGYENMFSSQGGESDLPLVGYTHSPDGQAKRVYAINPDDATAKIFDKRTILYKNTKFSRVPPPGITQVTVGRNKNGLLASGQINFSVPSLIQLETLHRTFLIPGVGMILEWGQQFALDSMTIETLGELPDLSMLTFPWRQPPLARTILQRLALNDFGLAEILENYTYPTRGQYMWMFGRVANFNTKANSDGSFDCSVKIVGPSEDAWAYRVRNTVVPAKDPSKKVFCVNDTNSVFSYFTDTSSGLNFKTLLDRTIGGENPWQKHVIKFTDGNNPEGDPETQESATPVIDRSKFQNSEDAYFITWRFFVNMVLNNDDEGIKAIFKRALLDPAERQKVGLLRPYATGPARDNDAVYEGKIDDPLEPFVGCNSFLRSIDPSVLIIVNEDAVELAKQDEQYSRVVSPNEHFDGSSAEAQQMLALGTFEKGAVDYHEEGKNDKGFLSTGVWINHKAVVESIIGADTILRGIVNLLDRMNAATSNYWQLTIDVAEQNVEGTSRQDYMVVDANHRGSSSEAVGKFLDRVHVFNKYIRIQDGELVGSELTDCSVELSLPKRLFSQIATLGLVQPEDIKAAGAGVDTEEESPLKSPKIDPDERLRQMFAITSLSASTSANRGPDLTILPKDDRKRLAEQNSACRTVNSQTTAQTAGHGISVDNRELQDASVSDLEEQQAELQEKLNEDICKQCKNCQTTATTQPVPPPANLPAAAPSTPTPAPAAPAIPPRTPSTAPQFAFEVNPVSPMTISSPYAIREAPKTSEGLGSKVHGGIDIEVPAGTPVKAVKAGVVEEARFNSGGYGLTITIDHGNGYKTKYSHLSQSNVSKGQTVTSGQVIALSGSTGKSTGPHLHFDLFKNGVRINPEPFVGKDGAPPPPAPTEDSVILPQTNTLSSPPTVRPEPEKVCTDDQYQEIGTIGFDFAFGRTAEINSGKARCRKCKRIEKLNDKISAVLPDKKRIELKMREFPGLKKVFKYIEVFPEYMYSKIVDSDDGDAANAFGAAPGTLSISADLTMPGINGIRIGELFWIDRIPAFYKAFGAFQVMSIEDTIGVEGWTTKIHAVFNYIGTKWREEMLLRLSGTKQ